MSESGGHLLAAKNAEIESLKVNLRVEIEANRDLKARLVRERSNMQVAKGALNLADAICRELPATALVLDYYRERARV